MTIPALTSRSAWKRTYSTRRNGYLRSGDRYMEEAPHEAPAHIRRPYSAKQWVGLTVDERRTQHKKNAEEFVLSKIGPMPGTVEKRSLTLSALEALVIQRADNHINDLRFVLNGTPDQVEAIVAAQLPAFRAKVFDELVSTYQIIEG